MDWLPGFGSYDSPLGHHPDRTLVPGVEIGSGSLGHGLPIAVGTALGLRAQGMHDPAVWTLIGDAELDEGSNHEAIAFMRPRGPGPAAHGRRRQLLGVVRPSGRDRRTVRGGRVGRPHGRRP